MVIFLVSFSAFSALVLPVVILFFGLFFPVGPRFSPYDRSPPGWPAAFQVHLHLFTIRPGKARLLGGVPVMNCPIS
jgi:hypothetical protein